MKLSFLCTIALLGSIIGSAHADPAPAGPFGPPISDEQTGPQCTKKGYKRDQYHMQGSSKYHMGEDLNGECGGNTDEGYPILALAEGEVVFLDDVGTVSGQGKRLYIRHTFPYSFAPDDVMTYDVALLHLQGMGPDISWSGVGTGSTVQKGQTVAYLGKTGTKFAHLHWEAQTDLTIPLGTNPYQNPLTITQALKYRAPSMIVDDRRNLRGYKTPQQDKWYPFTMSGNAPSSTMYLLHDGERKSLKNAIAEAWIPQEGILHEKEGKWFYYNDVDNNFFEDGKRYAIQTLLSGPVHYIPVPRNTYQDDRARLDMIQAVADDSRFVSIDTKTYERNRNWDPSWELHKMQFILSSEGTTWVYQATHKSNPLLRYTTYYDPNQGQHTDWERVDWNKLY